MRFNVLYFSLNENGYFHFFPLQSRGAIYSDAGTLVVSSNRIERLTEGAVDASVRSFVFSANTVDHAEGNALSVACLYGKIKDNIFASEF